MRSRSLLIKKAEEIYNSLGLYRITSDVMKKAGEFILRPKKRIYRHYLASAILPFFSAEDEAKRA
ncbi:protein of unknown function [Legionella micdadei]|uniref:Uncharacterized protein n=1 Tax=Legionella micdadei TaxID=451 RepID=A0A098GC20_LEGMI|nr:protein of unknown function [Legionella micdadei]